MWPGQNRTADTRIFSPLTVPRLCVTIGHHVYLFKRLTAVSAGRFYRFEHIDTNSSGKVLAKSRKTETMVVKEEFSSITGGHLRCTGDGAKCYEFDCRASRTMPGNEEFLAGPVKISTEVDFPLHGNSNPAALGRGGIRWSCCVHTAVDITAVDV